MDAGSDTRLAAVFENASAPGSRCDMRTHGETIEQEIFDRCGELVVLEGTTDPRHCTVAFVDFPDGQYCGGSCSTPAQAIESVWNTFLLAARHDVMQPTDTDPLAEDGGQSR